MKLSMSPKDIICILLFILAVESVTLPHLALSISHATSGSLVQTKIPISIPIARAFPPMKFSSAPVDTKLVDIADIKSPESKSNQVPAAPILAKDTSKVRLVQNPPIFKLRTTSLKKIRKIRQANKIEKIDNLFGIPKSKKRWMCKGLDYMEHIIPLEGVVDGLLAKETRGVFRHERLSLYNIRDEILPSRCRGKPLDHASVYSPFNFGQPRGDIFRVFFAEEAGKRVFCGIFQHPPGVPGNSYIPCR